MQSQSLQPDSKVTSTSQNLVKLGSVDSNYFQVNLSIKKNNQIELINKFSDWLANPKETGELSRLFESINFDFVPEEFSAIVNQMMFPLEDITESQEIDFLTHRYENKYTCKFVDNKPPRIELNDWVVRLIYKYIGNKPKAALIIKSSIERYLQNLAKVAISLLFTNDKSNKDFNAWVKELLGQDNINNILPKNRIELEFHLTAGIINLLQMRFMGKNIESSKKFISAIIFPIVNESLTNTTTVTEGIYYQYITAEINLRTPIESNPVTPLNDDKVSDSSSQERYTPSTVDLLNLHHFTQHFDGIDAVFTSRNCASTQEESILNYVAFWVFKKSKDSNAENVALFRCVKDFDQKDTRINPSPVSSLITSLHTALEVYKKSERRCTKLIIPIAGTADKHFTLLIIEPGTNKIKTQCTLYDSRKETLNYLNQGRNYLLSFWQAPTNTVPTVDNALQYIVQSLNTHFPGIDYKYEYTGDQTDDYNCGVFAVEHAKSAINNLPLKVSDINARRKSADQLYRQLTTDPKDFEILYGRIASIEVKLTVNANDDKAQKDAKYYATDVKVEVAATPVPSNISGTTDADFDDDYEFIKGEEKPSSNKSDTTTDDDSDDGTDDYEIINGEEKPGQSSAGIYSNPDFNPEVEGSSKSNNGDDPKNAAIDRKSDKVHKPSVVPLSHIGSNVLVEVSAPAVDGQSINDGTVNPAIAAIEHKSDEKPQVLEDRTLLLPGAVVSISHISCESIEVSAPAVDGQSINDGTVSPAIAAIEHKSDVKPQVLEDRTLLLPGAVVSISHISGESIEVSAPGGPSINGSKLDPVIADIDCKSDNALDKPTRAELKDDKTGNVKSFSSSEDSDINIAISTSSPNNPPISEASEHKVDDNKSARPLIGEVKSTNRKNTDTKPLDVNEQNIPKVETFDTKSVKCPSGLQTDASQNQSDDNDQSQLINFIKNHWPSIVDAKLKEKINNQRINDLISKIKMGEMIDISLNELRYIKYKINLLLQLDQLKFEINNPSLEFYRMLKTSQEQKIVDQSLGSDLKITHDKMINNFYNSALILTDDLFNDSKIKSNRRIDDMIILAKSVEVTVSYLRKPTLLTANDMLQAAYHLAVEKAEVPKWQKVVGHFLSLSGLATTATVGASMTIGLIGGAVLSTAILGALTLGAAVAVLAAAMIVIGVGQYIASQRQLSSREKYNNNFLKLQSNYVKISSVFESKKESLSNDSLRPTLPLNK